MADDLLPTAPLLHSERIVKEDGSPSEYFMRQWGDQRELNTELALIGPLTVRVDALEVRMALVEALAAANALAIATLTPLARAYDIAAFMPGAPTASQLILKLTFDRDVDFEDDFAGSVGSNSTNPTAPATINIRRNNISIGMISISTGGVYTFSTIAGATSFVAGNTLELVAQGVVDVTLADIAITLKGTKV